MSQEMGFRRRFVNRVIVPLRKLCYPSHIVMGEAVARKSTDIVKLQLRLSEALRRKLERAADREGRSMNTEIIRRLERTFAVDESAEGTNVLEYFRSLGIDVTEANEADVATAIGQLFGRWARWAPLRPPKKDEGEKK
jgi:Arc-like DNA binding dprotein